MMKNEASNIRSATPLRCAAGTCASRVGLAMLCICANLAAASPVAAEAHPPSRQAQQDTATECGVDDVAQTLLDARRTHPSTKVLAERLARCGPQTCPRLFDILGEGRFHVRVGERGNSFKRLTESERSALVEALGRFPWNEVWVLLESVRKKGPDETQRIAALQVVGSHGTSDDLFALLDWSVSEDVRSRVPRTVRAAFATALGSMLERHPETSRAVPDLYAAANLSLVSDIVSVLGARPDPASLSALSMLLGRVPQADTFVLAELGHLAKVARFRVDSAVGDRVRTYLTRTDLALLTEGIVALGRLEDAKAVEPLVTLLDHGDANVRARTVEALVAITGERLGPNPEVWKDWHARVTESWKTQAPEWLQRVRHGNPSVAMRAILQLAKLRTYRHELTGPLTAGLEREQVDIVILTCATLGHLGSVAAVHPLLAKLEASSVEVKRAAFLALRRITHEDHGEVVQDWLDAGW